MGSVSSIAELSSDPERLLNSSAGSEELEHALLGSLRAITVPAGAKTLVWNALGAQVVGAGVTATAVAKASSWAAAFWRGTLQVLVTSKGVVAVPVVLAAIGAGALHYHGAALERAANATLALSKPASVASVASPAPVNVAAVEPSVEELDSESEPANFAAADAPSHAAPKAHATDRLREESALLEQARGLLRSGHPRAAQSTLLHLQAEFPKGALTQEREVLLIETLAARGSATAAARDARTFVAAHPESPHAVQLRRFIDHPSEHDTRPN